LDFTAVDSKLYSELDSRQPRQCEFGSISVDSDIDPNSNYGGCLESSSESSLESGYLITSIGFTAFFTAIS
jgi:hypothetical protein